MKDTTQEKTGDRINILGVRVTSTSLSSVLEIINNRCSVVGKMRPFLVVTVNQEFVMLAQDDQEFKKILNSADLAIPDGAGLKLAGIKIKEIIPGRKLVLALILRNYRMFYLGGGDGVAKKMAQKYGGGYDCGHQDIKNVKNREDQRIIKKINNFQPDILLVAYGAPWQEKWLYSNLYSLNSKVVMGVGGTFDYLVGDAQLPPKFIERYGLEWLWRLVHQPWRWRRQLNLLRFLWLSIANRTG